MENDLIKAWQEDNTKTKESASKIISQFAEKHPKEIQDDLTKKINEEVTSNINCLDCANCCKTTVTTFTQEDIHKASRHLGVSKKEFIRKYLINDMNEYTTITTPCPFLLNDNKCKIYEVRPHACRSFPHTHKKNFIALGNVHKANFVICPITYNIVKGIELKINSIENI